MLVKDCYDPHVSYEVVPIVGYVYTPGSCSDRSILIVVDYGTKEEMENALKAILKEKDDFFVKGQEDPDMPKFTS